MSKKNFKCCNIKKCLNKGISTPVGIIVVLVLTIIVGGVAWYVGVNMEPGPSPTPSPTESPSPTLEPDETADWKIYTDDEYGFEIKYPNFYYIIDEDFGNVSFRNEKYRENPSGGCEFNILIRPNPLKKNLEEWLRDNSTEAEFATDAHEKSGKLYFNSKQANIEEINIGREKAIKFYQIGGHPNDWINTLVENGIYIIEMMYFPKCSSELDVFNQILSTFKFID
ncbi:hypothetical protein KKC63_01050 [Patescibacteria group bacterium]|nr:hypothetical protein [Patescibacteria group bacterium]MBU4022790.1 hypothetical protein [Patescibacteria group bacterium]MBU4078282.1 hypothetical protein [Patescibacteria group bacterium]